MTKACFVVVLAAIVTSAGCDRASCARREPSSSRPASTAPVPAGPSAADPNTGASSVERSPSIETAEGAPCEVRATRSISQDLEAEPTTVALSFAGEQGVVVYRPAAARAGDPAGTSSSATGRARDEACAVVPVDLSQPTATLPAGSLRVPCGAAIVALRPMGDAHWLLVRERCASGVCLRARLLDRAGHLTKESDALPRPEPATALRVTTTRDALLLAEARSEQGVALTLFRARGLGRSRRLTTRQVELTLTSPTSRHSGLHKSTRTEAAPTEAGPAEELPRALLALAAHENEWLVVWRLGAVEDRRSRIVLSSGDLDRTSVHTVDLGASHDEPLARGAGSAAGPAAMAPPDEAELDHLLTVESIAFDAREVSLIGSFEFAPPTRFRLDRGGDLLEPPFRLGPHDAPRAPLGSRRHAALDRDSGGLMLRVRSAAGYPVGTPIVVARASRLGGADVVRTPAGYLVAFGLGTRIELAELTCPAL